MADDLVEHYSQLAVEYERVYARPERQADLARMRDSVTSLFRGEHILEVACATGYWTEIIARSAHSVFATDSSRKMLAIAKTKDYGSTAVDFMKADPFALPVFDGHFNAGFAAFWWSRIPKAKIQEFLSGFHSHLEPGGKVVFIDNRYLEGSTTPVCRINGSSDTYQLRTDRDGSVLKVLKNFPTPEELETAVTDFGNEVEITLLEHFWMMVYRRV